MQVLQIEFNELCPKLLDRFIEQGKLPNFARLRDSSLVFTSDAEESGELLNPWVQWATIHTGMSAAEHGIETLSEGAAVAGKNVWDVLSSAGLSSWICGSMNASYGMPFRGRALPDPWSTGVEPYPGNEFTPYADFVRTAVQEHSNASGGLSKAAAIRFLRFLATHGLSLSTVFRTLWQIGTERVGQTKWRRAAVMDMLQLDLFRWYWRTEKPAFATFFLNSTAHFQHCYWRHFEPECFRVRPSEEELAIYSDAIPFGYRAMDRILGKLLSLVGPDCSIVFCTGLSQQPYVKFEEAGGRNFYRPHSGDVFRAQLGLHTQFRYEPVMAEQFYLRFESEVDADAAQVALQGFRVSDRGERSSADRAAFSIQRRDCSLLAQCNCTHSVPDTAVIYNAAGVTVPFKSVFYRLEALKSGYHHPDGALWIRTKGAAPRKYEDRVTIRSIAPTVLQLLGVAAPPWMTAESLLDNRETMVVAAV